MTSKTGSIDTDKCIGSGQSVLTCSMDVFRMNEKFGKSKIAYTGGLSDMSSVQNLLSCGCHHHHARKMLQAHGWMGMMEPSK